MDVLVKEIHRARERFLSGGGTDLALRPEVAASWERCRGLGIDPGVLAPPLRTDVELDTLLSWAARPVLNRLADQLAGTPTAILLADAEGGILSRWVGDPGLHGALEKVLAVPGSVLAEHTVGTNGLGTPLAVGAPVVITGAEHLKDGYLGFCCAGVPVRDPWTAAVLGAVTITCRAEHRNALLVPLLVETVERIVGRLQGERTVGSRLQVRTSSPVLSGASALPGDPPVAPMAGSSGAWAAVVSEGRRHIASGLPMVVSGETGVGKLHLIDLLWAESGRCASPGRSARVLLDAGRLAIDGSQGVLRTLAAALAASPPLVVLRHAELCDPSSAWAIASLLDENEGRSQRAMVAATSTVVAGEGALHPALRDRLGVVQLTIPPLRDRPEDIDALVAHVTARRGGKDHRWTAEALDALRRYEWPGNGRELCNVVVAALRRRRGDLGLADLPVALHRIRAAPLSHLQRLERDAIAEGLRAVRGNKAAAAELLGISRSTLYRKLRDYRLEFDG